MCAGKKTVEDAKLLKVEVEKGLKNGMNNI
jgi:hypothetical protein